MDQLGPKDDIAGAVEFHDGPDRPVRGTDLHRDRPILVRGLEKVLDVCVQYGIPVLDLQNIKYCRGLYFIAIYVLVAGNGFEDIESGRGARSVQIKYIAGDCLARGKYFPLELQRVLYFERLACLVDSLTEGLRVQAQLDHILCHHSPGVVLSFLPNVLLLHCYFRVGAVLQISGEWDHSLHLLTGVPFEGLSRGVRHAHAHVIILVLVLSREE